MAIASKTFNMYDRSWTSDLFYDSYRVIDSISKDLDKRNFFQLSWEDVGNNSVLISCNTDCAAIVVAWEHNSRQDSIISILTDQDWSLKTEQEVSWVSNDWEKGLPSLSAVKILEGLTESLDESGVGLSEEACTTSSSPSSSLMT